MQSFVNWVVAGHGEAFVDMAQIPEAVILEHAELIRQGASRRGRPWVPVIDTLCERVSVDRNSSEFEFDDEELVAHLRELGYRVHVPRNLK